MVQFTKLRLAGFKSFVDPTEVIIESGLTGIVGPNGCGKSNLVEALRWVMGENSAKRMRGGEMDDVIFAGSANRPSRNIAEVGLFLDNSARRAPAQFNDTEELEVSRRIERNSGSTFRVNGREVRARDVQLLFADAATGAHSTALVSQGRVGALINAKPTARRALLEEAAGITGLHSRRHEAELRLRAAETNLERLDDVISTLESQFQGLKRQARQASRYRNLAGHIRRNEAILLHLEAEAAKQGLAQAQQSHADCEAVVAELTQEAAGRAAEQSEAASVLPDLRQAEAEAAAALQRVLIDRDQLDREEAEVANARERAEARLEQIEHDRNHAQSLADDANGARTRLDQERTTLEAEAEGEATAQGDATEGRDAAATVVAEREAEVDRVAEGVATCEAQKAALERRHGELSDRLQRLRSEAEALSAERDRLVAEQISATVLETAAADLADAEQRLAAARERADTAETQLAERRAAESAAREALQKAESDCAKVDAEISALAAMLEPAESDIWPPIVDTISVDPGYEGALGAALGDDLIASTDEGAPVHWETLPRYQDTPALPAGAERLSDFVRAPEALDRRLAQIGVVADVADGERLQHALKTGQRLVSQDGGLWRWDGFTVRAGSQTTAARRLEQRNRLEELRPELERQQARVESQRAAGAAAQAAMEQAANAEREAREALRAAFAAVDGARDARASLAQKAAESSSRLTALGDTIERLEAELREATAGLERVQEDRAALPDLDMERAKLADLRRQLSEARGALAERQSALDRLLREAEVRAQRLAAIEQEKASWARRAEEADRYMTELAERRAQVDGELEALAARPDELAAKRDSLAEIITEAESRRRAAADALAMGETRQTDADRALKEQEQKLAAARENRVRAEAAVTQSRMTLDQIAEKVRERLECEVDQVLNEAEVDPSQDLPPRDEVETKLARLTRERDNMGPVNLRADQEAQELEQQIGSMQSERADLVSAIARLRQGIASLNREGRERLLAAFETVNGHFSELFTRLFGGGRAHLALTEAEDPLEAGLEIMASPPGKRLQVMSLLSGGEQALTALSLLFAVFLTNPAPICVLDEVDAPLDDANVDRFCKLVQELASHTATRFLIITHHRMTMARVDRLFGVTMAERGVSQLVSVDLDAAEELRDTA